MKHPSRAKIPVHFSMSLALATMCLLAGCTTQAWYEGMYRGAENDCNRQPGGEIAACKARVNKEKYDAYEKERAAQKP